MSATRRLPPASRAEVPVGRLTWWDRRALLPLPIPQSRPKLTPGRCIEIAAPFGGRIAAEDYAIFCELLIGWMAEQARAVGASWPVAQALALAHDDIVYSLRQADALNLDRRQTVTDALMRLEEALKAS